jgi:hypothetical protein
MFCFNISLIYIHHHNEHNQGLGLKTCFFKAQNVPGLFIFFLVFPYPAIPEVGTGKPASVGSFYPFIPDGLIISVFSTMFILIIIKLNAKTYFTSPTG